MHRWIFESPKERAFLSIGPYFGVFSWTDYRDVITCHYVTEIRDEVDDKTCQVWALLVGRYNAMKAHSYRSPGRFARDLHVLEAASKSFNDTFTYFFEFEQGELIRKQCPREFKACKAAIHSNLWLAEAKLKEEDPDACIQYLETALSTLHDVVDALAARVLKATA